MMFKILPSAFAAAATTATAAIVGGMMLLVSVAAAAEETSTTSSSSTKLDATGNLVLEQNYVHGACAVSYDPDAHLDYFPTKYRAPDIASYGEADIFGNQFVPHNTTDFFSIEYFENYKIVTNHHQEPPQTYLLYQCGTDIPQAIIDANAFDVVTAVPLQGGIALSQTPQIPYIELLGLQDEVVAYLGNPVYISSPCLSYQVSSEAAVSEAIEVVWGDNNDTLMDQLVDDFRRDHPTTLLVSGPTNNLVGENVIVASSTQERTNVATFDWIAFYAAFFNLEGEADRIAAELQASYDCTAEVSSSIVAAQQIARRTRSSRRGRRLEEEEKEEEQDHTDTNASYHTPSIFWAKYFTWGDLGWSVADCPTWDSDDYCEYAAHCGATILSRPDGVGFNQTYGDSPTVYWYLNDTEAFEMGKDADIFIYSGSDWEALYASHGDLLDQFKSVQNQQVFDTLGQGPSAWNEQRYAEYDTVGMDMCDVVGHSMDYVDGDSTNAPYMRRWFRNVFTEPIGSLGTCDVAGGEVGQPYIPPLYECVRPQDDAVASAPAPSGPDSSSSSSEQEKDPEAASSSSASIAGGYFLNLSLLLGIVFLSIMA